MTSLKHLPMALWPPADGEAFAAARAPRDIFDDDNASGAHLAEGTWRMITTAYRRWLGFLSVTHPKDLLEPPADRIAPLRVRDFVMHLDNEVRKTTVANAVINLYYAARLIDPQKDWKWLRGIGARLHAQSTRLDRFSRLVPPVQTLDYGIELMDTAFATPAASGWDCHLQYRDGLIIALLSLWPIRRRSLAALTVDRHLVCDDAGFSILLGSTDTKSKRAERCRLPSELIPYMRRYLDDVRPELLNGHAHSGLWPSRKGGPLLGGRIYDAVRGRLLDKFGKDMNLHDFRRSAATSIAIDMPDKIGLIPGVLQHAGAEVGEQHYNLANAIKASRRHAMTMADYKANLRFKFRSSKR